MPTGPYVLLINAANRAAFADTLEEMFEVRRAHYDRREFWRALIGDVHGLRDRFDTPDAVYLVCLDDHGRVCGGQRIAPSDQPNRSMDAFAELYAEPPQRDGRIAEVGRFFVRAEPNDLMHLRARLSALYLAIGELLIACGFKRYVLVSDLTQLSFVLQGGARLRPLGPPRRLLNVAIAAFDGEVSPASHAMSQTRRGRRSPVLAYAPAPAAPLHLVWPRLGVALEDASSRRLDGAPWQLAHSDLDTLAAAWAARPPGHRPHATDPR